MPSVSFDDNGLFYNVRYRIVSEDKNRSSIWSPIFRLSAPSTTDAGQPYTSEERIHIDLIGNNPSTAVITWNYPDESEYNVDPDISIIEKIFSNIKSYDIWLRWNPNNSPDNTNWSDWKFISTVSSNSFNVLIQDPLPMPLNYTAKQIGVSVQIPTINKIFDSRLSLYQSNKNI